MAALKLAGTLCIGLLYINRGQTAANESHTRLAVMLCVALLAGWHYLKLVTRCHQILIVSFIYQRVYTNSYGLMSRSIRERLWIIFM